MGTRNQSFNASLNGYQITVSHFHCIIELDLVEVKSSWLKNAPRCKDFLNVKRQKKIHAMKHK